MDEIVLAAAGTKNEDDISLQLRLYQARALQGTNEAALDAYKDALRSRKRDPELLNDARYDRGRLLLEMGKTSQA